MLMAYLMRVPSKWVITVALAQDSIAMFYLEETAKEHVI